MQRDRPRILHVVSRDQRRGAETVALELADELARLGWTNRLLALSAGTAGATAGVRTLQSGSHIRGAAVPRLVAALRADLRRQPVDVVLAHGGQAAQVAALAAVGDGPPVVWQRILELGDLAPLRTLPWRLVARRVAGVVALTPRVAVEMRERLGYWGPLWEIPNARRSARFTHLDNRQCAQRLRAELGVAADVPLVGFVGHLVPQKQPTLAVQAFAELQARGVRAHLVVAGAGPLAERMRVDVERQGLSASVSFLGHRDDVPELLAGLDVLLLSSSTESMTGTVIEAAMAGCPVAAPALDGLDAVVDSGVTGALAPPDGTPSTLADAVSAVLGHADREAVRAAARARGSTFSMEAAAVRYDAALRGVVSARRAASSAVARRIRVLHLMPDYGVGGAEQAVRAFCEHVDRRRVEPLAASLRRPRRDSSETVLPRLLQIGVPVVDLAVRGRADRSPLTLLRAALRLRRLVRQQNVDVVDSCLLEADLVARLALLGTGVKHVVHLVNTPYADVVRRHSRGRGAWRHTAARTIDRISGRSTDRFVALTGPVADAARRDLRVRADRMVVVSRGVDLSAFFPRQRSGGKEDVRLLAVGRLVPQKGHAVLLDAVSLLRTRDVRVRLTIVGEGPLQGELRERAFRDDLRGQVELRSPTRDVAALHGEHDVFVFPSLWEGQGNALVEAMASGMAAVASDIPTSREVLAGLAPLARAGDADELADAIEQVVAIGPLGRAALGERLRERAERAYDVRARVEDLVDLYEELALPRR